MYLAETFVYTLTLVYYNCSSVYVTDFSTRVILLKRLALEVYI